MLLRTTVLSLLCCWRALTMLWLYFFFPLVNGKKVHCTHLSTAMATSVKTEAETDIP